LPSSSEFTIPTLVTDESGESHWQENKENLTLSSSDNGTYESKQINVTNTIIEEFLPKTKTKFECSPVSQLITILVGTFTIHASDGKFKSVTPGSLILLQDNNGKGHQITAIGSGKHILTRTFLNPSQ